MKSLLQQYFHAYFVNTAQCVKLKKKTAQRVYAGYIYAVLKDFSNAGPQTLFPFTHAFTPTVYSVEGERFRIVH